MDFLCLTVSAVALIISFLVLKHLSNLRRRKRINKWTEATKGGKLVLHGMYGNNDFLPTPSPFVLKLETFLRFANIPYELDKSDIWEPKKGKTPWISHNGHHMGDSQFIVDYLKTKFDVPKPNYSEKERAIGIMARVMVEEHLYWCGVMWRFAFGGRDTLQKVFDGQRTLTQWIIFKMIAPTMKSMAWTQGVGRHSESEMISLMLQDLRAISRILGSNEYLLGNVPDELDCSIFAGLASAVFIPDSPVQSYLQDELKNLKEYAWRMREKYWPDWESVVHNKEQDRKKLK